MSDVRRIALVTSRFWPISGISQIVAGELAIGIQSLGCEVEIITSRWENRWSKSYDFYGVAVHRLPMISNGPWGNFRTQRALARQLTSGDFDTVIIFGLLDHFEATVRALAKSDTQIILRLDDANGAQPLMHANLNRKILPALERVDVIVCTHPVIRKRLTAIGIADEKVMVIVDGVSSTLNQPRTFTQQSQSRISLSDAHPVLTTDPTEPLVITGMPLEGDAGIFDLIEAWELVARKYPAARLWIMGDGTFGKQIWNQITKRNLVYSIIMPGFFDDLDDVFLATDIYVNPSRDAIGHACLSRAMANGVCPVSTDDLGGLLTNDCGVLVGKQNPVRISEAILTLIADADRRHQLGVNAMNAVTVHRSFETTLGQYHELIQQGSSCEQTP